MKLLLVSILGLMLSGCAPYGYYGYHHGYYYGHPHYYYHGGYHREGYRHR